MGGKGMDGLWYPEQPSWLGLALGLPLEPVAMAYRAGLAVRNRLVDPVRVSRPVVSVGNLTLGGNGKTPLVIELVRLLEEAGVLVAVLSRGYGRKVKGTRVVHMRDSGVPAVEVAGDEPALISARRPGASVVVGEDRVDAAQRAIESCGPDVIVCDDAFQHIHLARDLDVLAVHARRGFGNGRLFPRGPLREPLDALARADLVVFTHAREQDVEQLRIRHRIPTDLPCAACAFEPAGLVRSAGGELLATDPPRQVVAACAIADPGGFFTNLERTGIQVLDGLAFGDHHRFTRGDWDRISERMRQTGAEALVMTEKDLVKVPAARAGIELFALRLRARWQNERDQALVAKALLDTLALRPRAVS